jgi:hypothetical protein
VNKTRQLLLPSFLTNLATRLPNLSGMISIILIILHTSPTMFLTFSGHNSQTQPPLPNLHCAIAAGPLEASERSGCGVEASATWCHLSHMVPPVGWRPQPHGATSATWCHLSHMVPPQPHGATCGVEASATWCHLSYHQVSGPHSLGQNGRASPLWQITPLGMHVPFASTPHKQLISLAH